MVPEAAVEIVALAEAANEDDARDNAPFGADGVDLALDKVADLLDHGLEDVFDLVRCHNEESRVEAGVFIVRETGEPGKVSNERCMATIAPPPQPLCWRYD